MGYRGLDIEIRFRSDPEALMRALEADVLLYDEHAREWESGVWRFRFVQRAQESLPSDPWFAPSDDVQRIGTLFEKLSGTVAEIFGERRLLTFDFGFDVGAVPAKVNKLELSQAANQVIARFRGLVTITMYPHDE